MVWILFFNSTWVDLDTHYDDLILGVYTTEEKAKEAMEKARKVFSERDKYDLPLMCDEWDLSITEFDLDTKSYYL